MTRRLATLATLLLAACGAKGDPDPAIKYYPTELTLPIAGRADVDLPWYSVGIVNATWFAFDVENVRLTGDGASFLDLEAPGGAAGTTLDVRESVAIRVRVRPADAATIGDWSTTEQPLSATLEFSTVGTGAIDPNTGALDASQTVTTPYTVGIRFKLSCDLDGDGADADACFAGTDCDDRVAAIRPDADEVCDGIDNDCSGTADDACTEL